jgi:hypothetical protein
MEEKISEKILVEFAGGYYILCFTDSRLIYFYIEDRRYSPLKYKNPYLLMKQDEIILKKIKEIDESEKDLGKFIESHKKNFIINYSGIEEVRFGIFTFDIKLYEKHPRLIIGKKLSFSWRYGEKEKAIDLFMKFLPTKTIAKKKDNKKKFMKL